MGLGLASPGRATGDGGGGEERVTGRTAGTGQARLRGTLPAAQTKGLERYFQDERPAFLWRGGRLSGRPNHREDTQV